MTDTDPRGVSGPCAYGGAVRCWPCMLLDCRRTPTLHVWWDDADELHAAATDQPKPSGWCGCTFCGAPAVKAEGGAT